MAKEVRIKELTLLAEKLKVEHYTEYEMIREMIEVRIIVLNYLVICALRITILTVCLNVRIPYFKRYKYLSETLILKKNHCQKYLLNNIYF